jgi:hypothetical protein
MLDMRDRPLLAISAERVAKFDDHEVGASLRKYSIDELPQLLNALNGTMSLGGRRALPAEVSTIADAARRRLLVRPGMAGLWTLEGQPAKHDVVGGVRPARPASRRELVHGPGPQDLLKGRRRGAERPRSALTDTTTATTAVPTNSHSVPAHRPSASTA